MIQTIKTFWGVGDHSPKILFGTRPLADSPVILMAGIRKEMLPGIFSGHTTNGQFENLADPASAGNGMPVV